MPAIEHASVEANDLKSHVAREIESFVGAPRG